MKWKFCLLVLPFFVIWGRTEAGNGEDTKLTKNITRSFSLKSGDNIEVFNKYGKVIVNTWDKDSVKFSIDIVASGKTDDIVDKLMNKVEIDFNYATGFLMVETEMDKKSGPFSSVISTIEDYSKTSFGSKNKVTIDYNIQLPSNVDLTVENKFGDVFINDFQGNLELDLSHGDLRARKLSGESDISLSFSKSTIKGIEKGIVKLKGAEVDIEEAQKLTLQSSSSEITLGTIGYLKVGSRNDQFRVDNVARITGTGDFSDFQINNLMSSLDLNLEYGEFFLERVDSDFKNITIKSKSADMSMILSPKSYFKANISGHEDRMIIPNNMLSLRKTEKNEESDLDFALEGFVGNTRELIGKLNIIANNADLIISIKETPIFTDRD